jgi:hypothetical protein
VLSRLKLSRLERIHNINGFIATIIKRTQREGLDDVEGDMGLLPRAVERRLEGLLAEVCVGWGWGWGGLYYCCRCQCN